jgi:hypothetical protein
MPPAQAADITVPANVQGWQSFCKECTSMVAVLFMDQDDMPSPPLKHCPACGERAMFWRIEPIQERL